MAIPWVWSEEGGHRTVSVSTGYVKNLPLEWSNSNMAMSHFFQEIYMAQGAALDMISGTWWRERNGRLIFLVELPINIWVSFIQTLAYHEMGRYSRYRAFGWDAVYKVGVRGRKIYYNNFSFTAGLFVHPWDLAITFPTRRVFHPEGAHELHHRYRDGAFIMAMAGLNNIMRFAGDLADGVYNGRAHSSEFLGYLLGKLGGTIYPRKLLKGLYRLNALPVSKGEITSANVAAFVLSASTYSYILSFFQGPLPIDRKVIPLEVLGIRVPDLETYFMTEGISYKVKTGFRVSHSLNFPIAVELIGKGSPGYEVTLGVHKHFEDFGGMSLGVNVMFGRGLDWDVHVRFPLGEMFFLEGLVEKMGLKSYYGERNIPTLEHGHHAYSFLVRTGLRY